MPATRLRRVPACRTTLAGTHADVREVVPEGLSIGVDEMRALVQLAARHARRPAATRSSSSSDADRLTEQAANALLKAVEEPPDRTVFLLCAPSDHPDDVPITIRSRCRVVSLHSPPASAIAAVLARRDGIDPATAEWAASVCGGHIGRARHLATDAEARARRERVLAVPLGLRNLGDAFAAADELVKAARRGRRPRARSRDAGRARGAGRRAWGRAARQGVAAARPRPGRRDEDPGEAAVLRGSPAPSATCSTWP